MKMFGYGLVLVFLAGCGGGGLGELKDFSSPEGGFKVKIPGTPKKVVQNAGGVTMNMFAVEGRSGAMMVAYSDMPFPANPANDEVEKALDGGREGMLANLKGSLVKEDRIKLGGQHSGRQITAKINNPEGLLKARFWLAGNRMYQAMVVGKESLVNSPDATTFLESFQLAK